jgi:hypothetical protein
MVVTLGLLVALLSAVHAHAQTEPTSDPTAQPDSTSTSTSDSASTSPADATSPSPTASTAPARTPKVAIVVVGDPDAPTVAAATELDALLASESRVTVPSDPAMRAALRGEGHDDGLDELRSERRRLGLGESRDLATLTLLGELVSADLVLVVRAQHGAYQVTAFDVLRRSFYDGELAISPIDADATRHFVIPRARRAARPLAEGEVSAPPPTGPDLSPEAVAAATTADPPREHEPDFWEQSWPYFVAGALLVAGIVFVVVGTTNNNASPQPVLRFQAGSGS